MKEVVALHVWVSGRVQGVFFRDSTRHKCLELGLSGWVRNLADGRVEALIVGTREACGRALEFIHTGPRGAMVTGVEHAWEDPPPGGGSEFEIRF